MGIIVPEGTDEQVPPEAPCWEYLGRGKGYCTTRPSGWLDGRTYCAKHISDRLVHRGGVA